MRLVVCSFGPHGECPAPEGNEVVRWFHWLGPEPDNLACLHCVGIMEVGCCPHCGAGDSPPAGGVCDGDSTVAVVRSRRV